MVFSALCIDFLLGGLSTIAHSLTQQLAQHLNHTLLRGMPGTREPGMHMGDQVVTLARTVLGPVTGEVLARQILKTLPYLTRLAIGGG